jgi:hypothetical protein
MKRINRAIIAEGIRKNIQMTSDIDEKKSIIFSPLILWHDF